MRTVVPSSSRPQSGAASATLRDRRMLQEEHFTQQVVNARHPHWDLCERGLHLAGYIAPSYLETLEMHLSLVPVRQGTADWSSQNWVVDALKGLNHPQIYAVQMDHQRWVEQMEILEEAWDVGDA